MIYLHIHLYIYCTYCMHIIMLRFHTLYPRSIYCTGAHYTWFFIRRRLGLYDQKVLLCIRYFMSAMLKCFSWLYITKVDANIIQFLKQLGNVHHCIILSKKKKNENNRKERTNGLLVWWLTSCYNVAYWTAPCVCICYISSNEKQTEGTEKKKRKIWISSNRVEWKKGKCSDKEIGTAF